MNKSLMMRTRMLGLLVALVSILIFGARYAGASPVAYWNFDNDTVTDLTGNGHDDGTTSGLAFVNAPTGFGRALDVSPFSNIGGTLSNFSLATGTVTFRVNPDNNARGPLFSIYNTVSDRFHFERRNGDLKIAFTLPGTDIFTNGSMTSGTWYTVVATQDGTAWDVQMQEDGGSPAVLNITSSNHTEFTDFLTTINRVELGALNSAGLTFDGKLDDIAVFDSPLSQPEIDAIFAGDLASVVPEPASLALLGLGCLAMLMRRRRV